MSELRQVAQWRFMLGRLLAVAVVLLAGCVSWVAEYDKATEDRLIATYEKVNRLYDALAQAAPGERTYDKHAKAWADVSTDLRVIALRQQARPNNAEMQKIMEKLIANYERTRAGHKERSDDPKQRANAYRDSALELDRSQLEAQFAAAVKAEVFKK
jgi:hypothetical protein